MYLRLRTSSSSSFSFLWISVWFSNGFGSNDLEKKIDSNLNKIIFLLGNLDSLLPPPQPTPYPISSLQVTVLSFSLSHTHTHTHNHTHSFPMGWRTNKSAIFCKIGLDLYWILTFVKVMFIKLKQNPCMDMDLI